MQNIPPFLSHPAFWFALVNAIIIFLPRFGITLSSLEVSAINLVVAAAFNVAPPINGYIAAKRYEASAKAAALKAVALPNPP